MLIKQPNYLTYKFKTVHLRTVFFCSRLYIHAYIYFEEVVLWRLFAQLKKTTRHKPRFMRAEAESEGKQGMLMVGNEGVNRVGFDCFDFKNFRDVSR